MLKTKLKRWGSKLINIGIGWNFAPGVTVSPYWSANKRVCGSHRSPKPPSGDSLMRKMFTEIAMKMSEHELE